MGFGLYRFLEQKFCNIFAEGQSSQCYWIGCVQDEFMNYMVPQGQPVDKPENILQEPVPKDYKDKKLPVGEYNKKRNDLRGEDPR